MDMKRILFVEDDNDILELLSEYFSNFAEVFTAPEGKAGLSVLETTPVDVVVTDLNMPNGMSGFEFIENMNKNGVKNKIYVLSGYNENKLSSLQIDGFFSKPAKFSELKEILLKE